MKLLNKTNTYFLGVSLIIFCLGGILFYLLFQIIIDTDINNKLHERKTYNLKQLALSDSLVFFQKYSANMVSIRPIKAVPVNNKETISDTVIFDDVEGKPVHYRQLAFAASINNHKYFIQERRALVEQKDLIEGVILLEGILFVAFVAILTAVNNQLSRSIWRPFYYIVEKISNYKVDLAGNMVLPKDSIDEFNELSDAIEKMSAKINIEFNIQKEFIENASHEIQTPLTIVSNKLEMLLQTSQMSDEQLNLVNTASVAIARLSRLNEALLILSKIENRQFHKVEKVCINDLIDHRLADLSDLILIKSISLQRNYRQVLNVAMHPYLAEMLLENLVVNSIKHNTSPGTIQIATDHHRLEMSNTGSQMQANAEKFFRRFVKGNPNSQSLGLGLSIVKAICETYMFPLSYQIDQNIHRIRIDFLAA